MAERRMRRRTATWALASRVAFSAARTVRAGASFARSTTGSRSKKTKACQGGELTQESSRSDGVAPSGRRTRFVLAPCRSRAVWSTLTTINARAVCNAARPVRTRRAPRTDTFRACFRIRNGCAVGVLPTTGVYQLHFPTWFADLQGRMAQRTLDRERPAQAQQPQMLRLSLDPQVERLRCELNGAGAADQHSIGVDHELPGDQGPVARLKARRRAPDRSVLLAPAEQHFQPAQIGARQFGERSAHDSLRECRDESAIGTRGKLMHGPTAP